MERIFGKFWGTARRRLATQPGYVHWTDVRTRLEVFARCLGNEGTEFQLGGSLWSVGFVGQDLLVPIEAAWTPDPELNLRLYEYLILKSAAIRALKLQFDFHDRSRIAPRVWTLSHMPSINNYLDDQFPQFRAWESDLLDRCRDCLVPRGVGSSPIFQLWKALAQSRSRREAQREVPLIERLIGRAKRNDEVPAFLHATVPLPLRKTHAESAETPANSSSRPSSGPRKRRDQKEIAASVQLEGPSNPVAHSFEKTEALDDYEGGRRAECGEDDLEQHQESLEEVELSRMTRSGSASSIYSQEAIAPFTGNEGRTLSESVGFSYPEWSARRATYWRNYCTVWPTTVTESGDEGRLKALIQKNYGGLIRRFKNRMIEQLNIPLWRNRLVDGPELDIDNVIRLMASSKGSDGRPAIYSAKEKLNREVSLALLIDNSYSTDSWIAEKRILDVILHSVGVAGLLFEGVLEETLVASTSSETRKRVDFRMLKDFSEDWAALFSRAGSVEPQQYTRLGPAIRHAAKLLTERQSPCPVMILLTDGKPVDLDPYEGAHGEADVRMAVREAWTAGIKVMTLTFSDQDLGRLAKMFDVVRPISGPEDFCSEVLDFLDAIVRRRQYSN